MIEDGKGSQAAAGGGAAGGAAAGDKVEEEEGHDAARSTTPRVPPPALASEDAEMEGAEDSFQIDDDAMEEAAPDADEEGGDDDAMAEDGGAERGEAQPTTTRPSSAPAASQTSSTKLQLEKLIKGYFVQMAVGCGDEACGNLLCRTNARAMIHLQNGGAELSKNKMAALAVQLAKKSQKIEVDYLCASCVRDSNVLAVVADHSKRIEAIQEVLPAPWPQNLRAVLDEKQRQYLCTPSGDVQVMNLATVQQHCEAYQASSDAGPLVKFVGQSFSDERVLSYAFLKQDELTSRERSGLDIQAIQEAYGELMMVENEAVQSAMHTAVSNLVKNLRMMAGTHYTEFSLVEMRQFMVLLMDPSLMEYACEDEKQRRVLDLMYCATSVPDSLQEVLTNWLKQLDEGDFSMLLAVFQSYITVKITAATVSDEHRVISLDTIFPAVKMLGLLHKANETLGFMQPEDFYNDAVNQIVNMKEDYKRWEYWVDEDERHTKFSFCAYSFILDAHSKSIVIRSDGERQMQVRMRRNLFAHLLGGGENQLYLKVKVRRDHLLEDAPAQFDKDADDLKKPLKVSFRGEEGVDEGGVKREFFQLLTPQLLKVDFGMFTYNTDTRTHWFKPGMEGMYFGIYFELLGKIVAVAIFNGVILDLPFPSYLWRRMCTGDESVGLDDMREIDADIANGLQQLLDFDGDVQEMFELTFTHDTEEYGMLVSKNLKPGGAEIPVTNENKGEYVRLYVNHVINELPQREIQEFIKGFKKVMDGRALQLCTPKELEMIVVGSPELDFTDLENAAVYEDQEEFNKDHVVSSSGRSARLDFRQLCEREQMLTSVAIVGHSAGCRIFLGVRQGIGRGWKEEAVVFHHE
eukprot:COSAG02_NODE_6269_length_3693_cov_9.040345_1_plen_859_part_00